MGQIPDSPAGFSRGRNLLSGSTLGAALVTIDLVKGKKCSYSPFLSSFALVFLLLLLTVRGTESPLLPQLTQASFVSPPVSPTAPALPSARAGSEFYIFTLVLFYSQLRLCRNRRGRRAHILLLVFCPFALSRRDSRLRCVQSLHPFLCKMLNFLMAPGVPGLHPALGGYVCLAAPVVSVSSFQKST